MHRNGGLQNNTERIGSILLPFVVGVVSPIRSIIEYKICRSTFVCITLCHVRIIYIHSTSIGISKACICLGLHEHHVANGICRDSWDMAYHWVTNEVLKTPTAKNSAIVMATNKQFLANYLLKSLDSGKNHHLVGSSLELVMEKFNTLIYPNYHNFVSRSKRFLRSR